MDSLKDALKAGEANYRHLVDTANSIILRVSRKGIVTYINRFGLKFFGFKADEILGKTPLETILPRTFEDDTDPDFFGKLIENPAAFAAHTNQNIKKDGTRVWITWSNRGVLDDDGNVTEVLCIGNDITRLKHTETRLSGHQKELEELVQERTRELSETTFALMRNQERLMVLNSISSAIIQDRGTEHIISKVLDQLCRIFKDCRAAYTIVKPGAERLRIDCCRGPEGIADLKGRVLTVTGARRFFVRLVRDLKPHVVGDIRGVAEKKALKELIKNDEVMSFIIAPIHSNGRILGLIHVYSPKIRQWEATEIELLEQIGESLSVAVVESINKHKLMKQELFLENVFDGVDIGILVLGLDKNGGLEIENINPRCRERHGILSRVVVGRPFEVLADFMPEKDFLLLKTQLENCVCTKETLEFTEEEGNGENQRTWLTRIKPVGTDSGTVSRLIMTSTDITEQKKAERMLQKKEVRLTEAQRIAKLGDCERDFATMGLSCSGQLLEIFGWDGDFCPGFGDFMEIVHPEDRGFVEKTFKKAVSGLSGYDMEYRILRNGKEERIVNEIGEVVSDTAGKASHISCIVQDVTQQKAFRDEIEVARKVFDNTLEGVVVTDRGGRIQFVNKGFTRITGYEPEEVIGQNPRVLKSDRHNREFYREMWDALDEKGHWAGEIWNRRKSGEAYPEWLSIAAITDRKGNPVRYMSVFNDLSDLREREKQIHFQANYDALTGLPNRTLLMDRLKMAIRRTFREKKGLALIFLDLDDFKHVNDVFGHAKGDRHLQECARRLLKCVREQDTVARYGGDDFVILLPETPDTEVIIQVLDRIKASLTRPFSMDGKSFFMDATMGVTICPDDGTDADVLIANADMAMYRAKEQGKGRYGFFTPELNRRVARRFELENDLRLALKNREFVLYFQPKYDLTTGRICGAEALVRWRHPTKGMIPPMDFIPLSEENGLVVPMGEWILDKACEKAAQCTGIMGEAFRIAVNISPRQVKDVDLLEQVEQALDRHGLTAASLELEITENALMGNVEKAKVLFNGLDQMGVHISIDDFGTGFSSLSYLRLFPIHSLKIDKSFVDDIPEDADSNTMVVTIISMAKHLNLQTIAEGVETKEQLEFLKTNHCGQVQGYFYSPPLSESDFMALLEKDGASGSGSDQTA